MKIQITKCDKCGKEIKDNETMNVLSLNLCMNCYDNTNFILSASLNGKSIISTVILAENGRRTLKRE